MTQTSTEPTIEQNAERKYPTLRSAARLYLCVILATILIVGGLGDAIDVVFLRLMAALFVFGGFTIAALLITDVRLDMIMGGRPGIVALGLGLLAGFAVWAPATWLLSFFSQLLGALFGNRPRTGGSSDATLVGLLLMFGLIIPLCEGLLFFGFIQKAAQGIGRWRGIWLTALLFGLFGMFSAGLGMSAAPAYFLVALVAGSLTLYSRSIWSGVLVLSGFNLGEPVLRDALLGSLLKGQVADLLSLGWLTTLALTLFVTFMLVQLSRALAPQTSPLLTTTEAAKPKAAWWLPLIVVIALCVLVGYGEIVTRSQHVQTRPRPTQASGSTAPPLSSTLSSTAPSGTPSNLQAPQPTNQKP